MAATEEMGDSLAHSNKAIAKTGDRKLPRWRRWVVFTALSAATVLLVGCWWYMFKMPGQSFQNSANAQTVQDNGTSKDPGRSIRQDAVIDKTGVEKKTQQSASNPVAKKSNQVSSKKPESIENGLKRHVVFLADEIGERNLSRYTDLCLAADYVEQQLTGFGLEVKRQEFDVKGLECFNLISEIKGSKKPNEILIIGAHYDSAQGTPAANDNGSGVAAMLVLAGRFATQRPERTIRFVGFTNEEPPYFQRENKMGSWVYARECKQNNDNIVGVLSLETMGYFTSKENSQNYPPPLNLMYPSTGNFIGFVANLGSRDLLHQSLASFREHAKVPSEGACLPGQIQGVGWSDHWSFWQEGYPGIMVTDTAIFRYPHYHKPTDTPDKLDYVTFAKVVAGLENVINDLSKVPDKSTVPDRSTDKQTDK